MVPAYPSLVIYKGIYMYYLLCTDNDKDIHLHSTPLRFLLTVKDYVPVDNESVKHNMWVLLMFRSLMVHA